MTNKRCKEIEEIASNLRKVADITSFAVDDIFGLCKIKNYYSIRYPIGDTGISGAAILRDYDRIIFSNSSNILSREIFTVAHELGHFELGHFSNDITTFTDLKFDNDKKEEEEANYFAACFLMPEEKVRSYVSKFLTVGEKGWSCLDIADIQGTFNVSFDTVLKRLVELKIMEPEEYHKLKEEKTEKRISKLLQVVGYSAELCFPSKTRNIPKIFLYWAISNYENNLIPKSTLEKALKYFNIEFDDIGLQENVRAEDNFDDLDEYLSEEEE